MNTKTINKLVEETLKSLTEMGLEVCDVNFPTPKEFDKGSHLRIDADINDSVNIDELVDLRDKLTKLRGKYTCILYVSRDKTIRMATWKCED